VTETLQHRRQVELRGWALGTCTLTYAFYHGTMLSCTALHNGRTVVQAMPDRLPPCAWLPTHNHERASRKYRVQDAFMRDSVLSPGPSNRTPPSFHRHQFHPNSRFCTQHVASGRPWSELLSFHGRCQGFSPLVDRYDIEGYRRKKVARSVCIALW